MTSLLYSPRLVLSLLLSCMACRQRVVESFATPSSPPTKTTGTTAGVETGCPPVSPATGLPNRFYTWRCDQRIRYQTTGPVDGDPLLLVHGLFVNGDHWRKTMTAMSESGYRVYALDLWGCGYSDKPPRDSNVAQRCNGERGRFDDDDDGRKRRSRVLAEVELGTANGRTTRVVDVDLCHPLASPYNFFTWSELLTDFSRDVILRSGDDDDDDENGEASDASRITLVSNSIGTISALQAVLDAPDLYRGVFVVCPNFRELHSAEVPFSRFSMPLIRRVQRALRDFGQGTFDYLATPQTVKRILREPYAVTTAVDDVLVRVLLDPLLTPGASDVVFDTLSYSAGPLPEPQLATMPSGKPVWIVYGERDPWTPGARVEALVRYPAVERVVQLPGVGHCPHDEAPEQVHPVLLEFLQRVQAKKGNSGEQQQQ